MVSILILVYIYPLQNSVVLHGAAYMVLHGVHDAIITGTALDGDALYCTE